MTIGERIQQARKHKGLTQKTLAVSLGVATGTIQQYELDKRRPRLDQLQRIAELLDVPAGELLGTIPQPDREYEDLCDVLNRAGLSIEATGLGEGPDETGDCFYIWHTDAEDPTEDRVEIVYRDLLRIVETVQHDADAHRIAYLQKRLDAEIF